MGFWGFVIFALKCFDVLAWPLFALGYPLCASIQAIETNSNWHIRKLVTYWVLFSLISLFEHAFVKLLEWVPFWSYTKLMTICWLVIPRFDGAFYTYKHLVRPCLSMDLQILINWFDKWKDFVLKRDDILAEAERHVKENGPEALEKLIASKEVQKEWTCAICQVTTQSETTLNLHLQGWRHQAACEKLKAKNQASKTVKVTKKKEVTEAQQVNQPKPNLAHTKNRTLAPVEIKETTVAVEAGGEHPQIPAFKEVQKEWTCAICQITTPSKTTLNLHLQEKRHQAACEKLKAINQASKTVEVTEKKEVAEATQVKETLAAVEAGGEHPQILSFKEVQKEWACAICQVTTKSETTLNFHLQGWQHQATCEKLTAKNQVLKTLEVIEKKEVTLTPQVNQPEPTLDHIESRTFAPVEIKEATTAVEAGREHPQIPSFKEVQKEWICAICKITTPSETTLNLHLQGKQHQKKVRQQQDVCEKLKAINETSKIVEVMEQTEVAEAKQVNQSEPNLAHIENKTFAPVEIKEITAAVTEGGKHRYIPTFKKVLEEKSQVTTQSETTLNLHLQGWQQQATCEKLKAKNQASKTVEITEEKEEVTEDQQVNQPKPNLAHTKNRTLAPVEIKETTVAVEAGGEHPQIPAFKEVQKEWTCAICQITTPSKTTLNLHLQEKRHQAACEKLKAINQASKTVEVTEKKEVAEATQVNQSEPNLAHNENKTFSPVEIKETLAAVEAGGEHPQIPSFKEVQKEWACAICQVTTQSETTLNFHLQGWQHQATCEKLTAKNQILKTLEVIEKKEVTLTSQVNQPEPTLDHIENRTFAPVEIKEATTAVEAGREHPQIPSFKEVQKEWICAICKITTPSETTLNLHLQGKKHQKKVRQQQDACEKLKAINETSKIVEVMEQTEVAEAKQVNQSEPNLAHIENKTFAPVEIKEITAAVTEGGKHRYIPTFKKVLEEKSQVTTQSETTLNLHLQGWQQQATCEKLKAKNQASKTVEITEEKEEVTEDQQVNQPKPNLAHTKNRTLAPVEIKETTVAVEAGGEHPQIPAFKEVQKEWTCAICQITTPSKTTLNLHLQEKRHQAACEKLKAINQASKTVEVTEKKEVAEATQVNQSEPNLAHNENKTFSPVEIKETLAAVEAGGEHPQIPSFKEVQKEWACAICQVTTQSETTLNFHLQGWQHQATCEKLTAKNQILKTLEVIEKKEVTLTSQVNQPEPTLDHIENRTFAPVEIKEATTAVEAGREHPQIPSFKEVQKEWICAICKITTPSETTLNLHLQGKKHQKKVRQQQDACEKLKAINETSKIVEVMEQTEVAEAKQVNQSEPNLAHIENKTFAPVEIKEITAAVTEGGKHRYIPTFKKVLEEKSQVTTQSETTLNLHLQGWQQQATCEKLKAKNQASKTVEITEEKEEVTEDQQVNQPKPNLAHTKNRTLAPVEIKETTVAVEAGGEHPQIPAFKEVQKEWTCAICQITTPSKTTLNLHLQEKRHQAACEKLKAINQASKTVEVTEKKEVAEATQVNQSEPNLAHNENKTFSPVEIKETLAAVEAGGEHPQIPSFKEVQKEWACAICQVTTQSETTLNFHLQGWQHQATCEKLTAKNQILKTLEVIEKKEVTLTSQVNQPEPTLDHIENRTFAPVEIKEATTAVEAGREHPQIPSFKEVQKEWICAICKITTPSETTLNLHLQGKKHQKKVRQQQDACEKLKAINETSKIVEVMEQTEVAEAKQVNQSEPNLAHIENKTFAPVEIKEITAAVTEGGKHRYIPTFKKVLEEKSQVTTQSETTLNLHLQGWQQQATCEKLKAKNQASKTVEITEEKEEVTEDQQVNQPKPNLAHTKNRTLAPVEIKETTVAVEAGGEHPQIPAFKEVQKEWTCAICQITTPSKTTLNLHLQEKRHQAACEKLKAINQASKTVEVTEKKEVAEATQVNQSEPNLAHNENKTFSPVEIKETLAAVEAGGEHPQIPSFKEVQKEWACAICQVTTQSETTLNFHLQGWQHQATCEKLTAKNQILKTLEVIEKKEVTLTSQVNQPEPTLDHIENRTFAPVEIKEATTAVEAGREHPQIPSFKEVQKEWICAICKITTPSETTLNLHLQGKKHQKKVRQQQDACEKLKAINETSKIVEVMEQTEVAEAKQVNQSEPNLAHIENKTFAPVEIKEITAAVTEGGKHRYIPTFKKVLEEKSQVTTQSETTLNLHLQGWQQQATCEKLKAKNQASKTVEITEEKEEVTEDQQVNQPKPNLAHTKNRTLAPVEIKETTVAVEAGGEHPQIPAFKEVQKEWTCAICQITTPSKTTLNLHLQEKRHQAACEKLKAINQASKTVEVTEKKEVAEATQVNQSEPNLAHNENKTFSPVEIKETLAAVEAGGEHPQIPSFKEVQKEWACAICQVTTQSETTLNFHLQGWQHQATCEKLTAKNQILKTLEVIEKKEVTLTSQVNQPEPTLDHIENRTFAPVEIKEATTAVEAGREHPQIPSFKEVQKEWICAICKITTPSETTLNLHLQGKKHQKKVRQQQNACEKLKAINETSKIVEVMEQTEVAEAKQVNQSEPNLAHIENKTFAPVEIKETTAAVTEGGKHRYIPPFKKVLEEKSQVTTQSETTLNLHLQGWQHQATCEKLKAKNQASKTVEVTEEKEEVTEDQQVNQVEPNLIYIENNTFAPVETKETIAVVEAGGQHPQIPSFEEVQNEWICAICQITTPSEIALNLHLQGKRHQKKERRHQAACEKLKANNQASESKIGPASASNKSDLPEEEKCVSSHKITSQEAKRSDLPKEVAENCASSSGLKCKVIATHEVNKYDVVKEEEEMCVSNNGLDYKLNSKPVRFVVWSPPAEGWFKLNINGSYLGNLGQASAGGIIRDQWGNWLTGFSRSLWVTHSLAAELWGLRDGLHLALNFNLKYLELELDAAMAVELIGNCFDPHHPLNALSYECRLFLSKLDRYTITHIPREANYCADALSREAYNLDVSFKVYDLPPGFISHLIYADFVRVNQPMMHSDAIFLSPKEKKQTEKEQEKKKRTKEKKGKRSL